VASSKGGRFPSPSFANSPRLKVLACNSNIEQRLNPSSPLIHSHANQLLTDWLKLKSKLIYASRPVCLGVGPPSGAHNQMIVFCLAIAGFLLWDTLSDERMGLLFICTFASEPCQSNHSWVEVPHNSRPYFTVSFETHPTWRARSPCLYLPGTGWPCYTPGHWLPFCRLLRLAELRWRYSIPPPHEARTASLTCPAYNKHQGTDRTFLLFSEPLVSNGYCIVVYFAFVTEEWVCMPQYAC
jgi:hypothetical protein